MIGVAFSLGFLIGGFIFLCQIPAQTAIIFLIGPMIGAAFSLWGKEAGGEWLAHIIGLRVKLEKQKRPWYFNKHKNLANGPVPETSTAKFFLRNSE